ncbi:MAG: sodium:calcium antiporter [Patescibacteria group bacterium]
MTLLFNLLFFVIACVGLILSGSFLVRSLTKISRFLRITEFVAAFVIISLATTVPELFVGISSAISRIPSLSLGNVIGSNIVNLTLVLGIPILLARQIKIESKAVRRDALYMVLLTPLPLILMLLGGQLSRLDGILLLIIFCFFSYKIYKTQRKFPKVLENHIKPLEMFLFTILFLLSIAALFFSAHFVVKYAANLAGNLNFAPLLIGLFLVALGTSLPELVFRATAAIKGHSEMALGNTIGANAANLTLVLGITALIYPIQTDFLSFLIASVFMVVISFVFLTFLESEDRLSWKEGLSLILLYVFFIIIEIYLQKISY